MQRKQETATLRAQLEEEDRRHGPLEAMLKLADRTTQILQAELVVMQKMLEERVNERAV